MRLLWELLRYLIPLKETIDKGSQQQKQEWLQKIDHFQPIVHRMLTFIESTVHEGDTNGRALHLQDCR